MEFVNGKDYPFILWKITNVWNHRPNEEPTIFCCCFFCANIYPVDLNLWMDLLLTCLWKLRVCTSGLKTWYHFMKRQTYHTVSAKFRTNNRRIWGLQTYLGLVVPSNIVSFQWHSKKSEDQDFISALKSVKSYKGTWGYGRYGSKLCLNKNLETDWFDSQEMT